MIIGRKIDGVSQRQHMISPMTNDGAAAACKCTSAKIEYCNLQCFRNMLHYNQLKVSTEHHDRRD